jgi:biotin carboxylase
MADRPVICVGFVLAALPTLRFRPEQSVIFVEEPDIVRKRDVHAKVAGDPHLREVIEWEHYLPGAADEFFNRYPDLDPIAVLPLVEYATPFAARVAERYGIPGGGHGAVQLLRDKSLLRRVASAAGIANPASQRVDGPEGIRAFMREHPGRVVIKPANRSGSVGTLVIDDPAQVDEAWQWCLVHDEGIFVPDRGLPLSMLVEQHVAGHEYSVEMLVRDAEPVFANVTDKLLFPGPLPIEQGHVVPAGIPDEQAEMLRAETCRLLRAIGYGTGVVHCEWIVSDGVPYLVECGGRFPGDNIVELLIEAYDFDLVRAYFTLMAGEPFKEPLPARATQAGAVRFITAETGVVEAVDGVEEARAMPGVVACDVSVEPGERTPVLRSSWDRIGHVRVNAATPDEAARLVDDAVAKIVVKVQPDID